MNRPHFHLRHVVYLLLLGAGFSFCNVALAADWEIKPRLTVSETYSDNIRLAPKGQEEQSFVTEISPGVAIKATGARFKFNLDYSMQNLIYKGDFNDHTTNHSLNARANAELIDQAVFVDSSATISNQNVNILGPQAFDNTNRTQNRTTARTFSVSPYWLHTFGSFGSSEVRYTYDVVDYDSNALGRSTGNRLSARFNSGPQFPRLKWGLRYTAEKIDYADTSGPLPAEDTQSQVFTALARYSVNSKFALVGYGGYEDYDYPTTRDDPSGPWWRAGFAWQPTSRTMLEATAGRRFYGSTYALNFTHRTRRSAWRLTYAEDVTTARTQQLVPFGFLPVFDALICDPRVNPNCLPIGFIIISSPQLVNENIISRRWEGQVTYKTGKNILALTAFNELREFQLSSLNDYRQHGVGATWNHRLAPYTTSDVSAVWTRSTILKSGREDDIWYFRVGVSHQFRPKLFGSVNFRHTERTSNEALGDYKENAITATVNMFF